MIKLIIVDDEINICNQIKFIIEQNFQSIINIVGVANNTNQAAEMLDNLQPDIALFDIELPTINAIEFLKEKKTKANIVFISAYNEYAMQALKLHALDFLHKPINESELIETLNWVIENRAKQSNNLKEVLNNFDQKTRITIHTVNEKIFLNIADIIYLEAMASYCKFYYVHNNSKKYCIASKPMNFYEDVLGSTFIRIHKSYIVNTNFVVKTEQNNTIVLQHQIKLEISRRRIAIVNQILKLM